MLTLSSNSDLHLADFFSSPFLAVLAVGIFFAAPFPELFPGIVRHIRTGLIQSWEIPILIVLLVAVLVQLSGNTYNPFIYFRF
jgi:branched-subunit amino acid transport protein